MIARRLGNTWRDGIGGNDENTLLLLHGDSLNNASNSGVAISSSSVGINNNGRFDKGLDFNGSSSWIDTGLNTSPFGSLYWTVDWWEYRRAATSNDGAPILAKYESNMRGDGGMALAWYETNNYKNKLYISSNGTSWNLVSSSVMWGLSIGAWAHYAVVRNSDAILYYKNGLSVGGASVGTSLPYNNGNTYRINWYSTSLAYSTLNAVLSEFRISNIARWTSNFTPPDQPYS
ncbi:LamG-like jellyroll fold domain-containing protein [Cloacibacillus evryensis]|uniref:LamG-like jellyroll fold domain-containing protein n=1 Tax=Cloacibacillus evryensis TaxID=508460 RepID=UPI002B21C871|nr:LamG-like jellyroll fold domain-containing protein [Cloacibacillus evryensis]MEA5034244.1 LamG-like jellyroll fold domain-containing protein [Cloacibacillus evryensis]